jgi:hypothetical protein
MHTPMHTQSIQMHALVLQCVCVHASIRHMLLQKFESIACNNCCKACQACMQMIIMHFGLFMSLNPIHEVHSTRVHKSQRKEFLEYIQKLFRNSFLQARSSVALLINLVSHFPDTEYEHFLCVHVHVITSFVSQNCTMTS